MKWCSLLLALVYLFIFSYHAISGEAYPDIYAPVCTACICLYTLCDFVNGR